jgi:hypothetical protein
MRDTLVGVVAVLCTTLGLCTTLAGCAATPNGASTAPQTQESQTSTPAPASPSASRRTKAQDAADLKKALVKARDLGDPWIQPKAVSVVKAKKGEVCPGHVSTVDKVTFTAHASTDLTEGRGVGKNIASIRLAMLPDEDGNALVAAYAADQKACARYRESGYYWVVRSVEGPTTFAGAEPVAVWAERIYYDKQHKKLAYARHILVVRQGRLVTYLSYAFLTTKKDPSAKDFTRASRLLAAQQDKNSTVFA